MKTNQDYKNAALAALKGNWGSAVLAAFLVAVITAAVTSGSFLEENWTHLFVWLGGASFLGSILVGEPLAVGYDNAMKQNLLGQERDILPNTFRLAFDNYLHLVLTQLLCGVYVLLWCLLLIVPGIIKAFAYSMTPFILKEHPELSADEAISKSRQMMKGHKADLFFLYLSFIGWAVLALFTCGIGFFWLAPYAVSAKAAFYEDIKESL